MCPNPPGQKIHEWECIPILTCLLPGFKFQGCNVLRPGNPQEDRWFPRSWVQPVLAGLASKNEERGWLHWLLYNTDFIVCHLFSMNCFSVLNFQTKWQWFYNPWLGWQDSLWALWVWIVPFCILVIAAYQCQKGNHNLLKDLCLNPRMFLYDCVEQFFV